MENSMQNERISFREKICMVSGMQVCFADVFSRSLSHTLLYRFVKDGRSISRNDVFDLPFFGRD